MLAFGFGCRRFGGQAFGLASGGAGASVADGFGRGGVRRRRRLDLQNGDGLARIAARKEGEHRDADHERPEHNASRDG